MDRNRASKWIKIECFFSSRKKIVIPDEQEESASELNERQRYKDAVKLVQEYEQWPDEAKQDFANAVKNNDLGKFYKTYYDAIQYVKQYNEQHQKEQPVEPPTSRTKAMRPDYDLQLIENAPELRPSGVFLVDDASNEYIRKDGKIYRAIYKGPNQGGNYIGGRMNPWDTNIAYNGQEYQDVPSLYMYNPDLQSKPLYYVDGQFDEEGIPKTTTISRDQGIANIKRQLGQLKAAGASDDNPDVQYLMGQLDAYKAAKRKKIYDDVFGENNPITGDRRIRLVGKYYNENNSFRQGADLAANIITNAFLATTGLSSIPSIFANGLGRGAARLGLGLAGGYAGGTAFNNYVMDPLFEKSWEEMMHESGARGLPVWSTNPGGWAGAYGTSRAGDYAMERMPAGYNNVKTYGLTYEGQPVETVKLIQSTETKLPGGQYVGARYIEHTSSPKAGRNTAGQKSWTTSRPNRAGQGVTSRASGNNTYSVRAETNSLGRNPKSKLQHRNYTFDRSHGNGFPLLFNQHNAPLITPPPIPFEVHYDQTKPHYDPWEIWYSQQPEATTQIWEGDPNSQFQAGPYKIERVYNFGATQNKQYDDEGWNVPGRTWTSGYQRIDGPMYVDQTLYEDEGGIPKNEKRDYTQRVDTSKSKKRKK